MTEQTPIQQGRSLDELFLMFTGRLAADPVLSYTNLGKPVCNLPVYCNRPRWTGELREILPIKFRVALWDNVALRVVEHLRKGSQVLITTDRIDFDPETGGPRTFTRGDGTAGASYEVTTFRIKFLGSPMRGEEVEVAEADVDEEIPFDLEEEEA